MAAVWARLRAEARSRWRAWLAVGLLVGLAGGAVVAAAAGARRTDTAYARFLRATDAPDVSMPIFPWLPIARYDVKRVAAIPQVQRLDRITNFFAADGPTVGASADPTILRRLRVVQGRLPRLGRIDEVVVGFSAVERLRGNVRVGSRLPVRLGFGTNEDEESKPFPFTFKVVGITASAADFPPIEEGSPTWSAAFATPAFHAAYARTLSHFELLAVRLRHGEKDLPGFEKALGRAVGRRGYLILRERDHAANVQRTNHLQAVALWLLAGLIAAAAALVLAQTLVRQTFLESADHGVLRALGMSRAQLWGLAMTRAALIGTVGAAVAVGFAWLLSPLTPTGLARTAEPNPGLSVNAALFGLGAAVILVLIILLAVLPAWRAARSTATGTSAADASGQERPSAIANAFARSGLPATTVAGARLAFERGRGHTAVPVRSTIAAVTIGIAALATAFGFAASLTHLANTPRLYGFTWDAGFYVDAGASSLSDELRSDPRIQAFSVGSGGYPLLVGRVPVFAMVLEGTVMPPILEGRGLRGGSGGLEILLASQTLRSTGAHVGGAIPVGIQGQSGRSFPMRIVGRVVFPPVASNAGLGRGAVIGLNAARTLIGEVGPTEDPPILDNELSVRFSPGSDTRAAFKELQKKLDADASLDHPLPSDITNFQRVDNLPIVLAGGVAALAAATMGHALVSSISRRRRDLAILKTLGFARGQVRRTVASQATAIIVVSLVVGLPIGIALGRWAWGIFATQIGIVNEPRASLLPVVLTIPGALLLANLLAAAPARVAARLRPALVLRTE